MPCNQPCTDLSFQVPHLKSDEDYQVMQIPYTPYPFTSPLGNELTTLYADDLFGSVINLPFPVCFFGAVYNQVVVSSNGLVSFDITNANCPSSYTINPQIPYYLGTICNAGSTYYPSASIMGAYSDLDPRPSASPADRKIEWRLEGTAPFRRLVVSWYRVGIYGNNTCGLNTPNTFQIVINESTASMDVFIQNKTCSDASNGGRAILGVQDWIQTNKYAAATGKNATVWQAVNEGYRFLPSGSNSRFVKSELFLLNGTSPIATAAVSYPASGLVNIDFTGICPPQLPQQYVVKTFYSSCVDPLQQIIIDDTITINQHDPVTATITPTATICNGATDGTVTVTPLSGTAPYSFSLDGDPPVSVPGAHTFTNVPAGAHTLNLSAANSCPSSASVTVAAGPILTTAASKTDVLCNGTATGTITVAQPALGTPPYEYSLDGVNWQTSNVFLNVAANSYTVYFRSADICPGTTTVTVNEPSLLDATHLSENGTCDGGADGKITVTAIGGAPGYQYSVDGVNFQASNVFNVLPNASYIVIVKDANGCLKTIPANVGLTNNLTFTPQTDATICESKSTQLQIITSGTKYDWSPRLGLNDSTINNPVASPIVTTQYAVKITKGLCVDYDTVVVNVNKAPIPNAGTDGFICYGQSYQLNAVNGVQYKWTPSTYLDNPNIANPLSTPTKDIIYTLSIISDVNGCASLTTDDITIDVTPPIKIKTYPADTVVYQSDVLQISAVPFDPDVIYFNWSPSLGLDNPAIANPTVTAGQIGEDIMYQVIGSTVAGCKGEAYVRVRVYKGPDIYVPTGFTPNGDGLNDKLIPFPVGIKQLNYFRVFNRWGQQIFSTSKLHDGWDGTINGTRQASGTYVWMAEAVTEQDKVITKKGVLTLIR